MPECADDDGDQRQDVEEADSRSSELDSSPARSRAVSGSAASWTAVSRTAAAKTERRDSGLRDHDPQRRGRRAEPLARIGAAHEERAVSGARRDRVADDAGDDEVGRARPPGAPRLSGRPDLDPGPLGERRRHEHRAARRAARRRHRHATRRR